MIQERGRFKKT